MKKVFTMFVLFLGMLAFNACTPNSVEEDESNTIYNVDRGEVEKPGNQGGNTGG